jgi:hypothetical protein
MNSSSYYEFKKKKKKKKLGLNTFLPLRVSTLFFFPLMISFLSHEIFVVFINAKMVPSLKFRLKLNGILRQCQSNIVTCHIINFFSNKKIKIGVATAIWVWLATPFGHGGGHPPCGG